MAQSSPNIRRLEERSIGVVDRIELLTVRLQFVKPVRNQLGHLDCQRSAAVADRRRRRHRMGRVRRRP